ncbi:hypothetical protein, partial [Nocardia mangyaensis]|uniref:hypothetical protein n=1 Tax=Nocardia mangyaensis TaxID=2213200 RepID=UPI002674DAB4
ATNNSQFTTSSGYIVSAGGPKALDVIGFISPTTGGFLAADQAVGYRIVWGIKDTQSNVILGEPSGRLVITNPAGSTESDVSLTFSVPVEVNTTKYFYQIYRTGVVSGAATDPGDDMNLVYEDNYDGSSTSITINEQQPESFRESGTLLYTNPTTGEGIAQSNAKPPIAKDIAKFKTSMFYANTTSVQNTQVTLLGLSGFISGTS